MLFKNLAIFDFQSVCVQENTFKDADTTKSIGEHILISVSISSNLINKPAFIYNSDPHFFYAHQCCS